MYLFPYGILNLKKNHYFLFHDVFPFNKFPMISSYISEHIDCWLLTFQRVVETVSSVFMNITRAERTKSNAAVSPKANLVTLSSCKWRNFCSISQDKFFFLRVPLSFPSPWSISSSILSFTLRSGNALFPHNARRIPSIVSWLPFN